MLPTGPCGDTTSRGAVRLPQTSPTNCTCSGRGSSRLRCRPGRTSRGCILTRRTNRLCWRRDSLLGSMVDGSVTALDCGLRCRTVAILHQRAGPAGTGCVRRSRLFRFRRWLAVLRQSRERRTAVEGSRSAERSGRVSTPRERAGCFLLAPCVAGRLFQMASCTSERASGRHLVCLFAPLMLKRGRVIWTNDTSHAIKNVRVDHNYLQESGISPQGHMLIAGDMSASADSLRSTARLTERSGRSEQTDEVSMLIVPNGRSMPAPIRSEDRPSALLRPGLPQRRQPRHRPRRCRSGWRWWRRQSQRRSRDRQPLGVRRQRRAKRLEQSEGRFVRRATVSVQVLARTGLPFGD